MGDSGRGGHTTSARLGRTEPRRSDRSQIARTTSNPDAVHDLPARPGSRGVQTASVRSQGGEVQS